MSPTGERGELPDQARRLGRRTRPVCPAVGDEIAAREVDYDPLRSQVVVAKEQGNLAAVVHWTVVGAVRLRQPVQFAGQRVNKGDVADQPRACEMEGTPPTGAGVTAQL